MATRPELVMICEELEIDHSSLSSVDMKKKIKEIFDKKYANVKYYISADRFSDTLRKFLTEEYDYIIQNKDGNELNYNFELKDK